MNSDVFSDMQTKEKTTAFAVVCGTSKGNRTPDFALRGQRLNRLTMEAYQPNKSAELAGELGFEPRQYESES